MFKISGLPEYFGMKSGSDKIMWAIFHSGNNSVRVAE